MSSAEAGYRHFETQQIGRERFSPLGVIELPQHELHGITTTGPDGRLDRLSSLRRDTMLDRIVSNAFGGRMIDGTPFAIKRDGDVLLYVTSSESFAIGTCVQDPDGKTRVHNLNHEPFVDAGLIHYCPAGGWGETDVVTMAVRNHGSMHPLGIHDFEEGERTHFFEDTTRALDVSMKKNGQALWGICQSAGSLKGPQSVLWLHGHAAEVAEPLASAPFEAIRAGREGQKWDSGLTQQLLEPRFPELDEVVRLLSPEADVRLDPMGFSVFLPGVDPSMMKQEVFTKFWDFLSFSYMYVTLESFHNRHYRGAYAECVRNVNEGNGNGRIDLQRQQSLLTFVDDDPAPYERVVLEQLRDEGAIVEPFGWAASMFFREGEGALLGVITTPFAKLGGIEALAHGLNRLSTPLSANETAKRYEPLLQVFQS